TVCGEPVRAVERRLYLLKRQAARARHHHVSPNCALPAPEMPRPGAGEMVFAALDAADEAQMLARGARINWLVRETGSPANLLNIDPYLPQRSAKLGTKSKVQIITAGGQQEAC